MTELALAVSLHFVEYGSNKEYHSLLLGRRVSNQYGRRGSSRQHSGKSFTTHEQAAAEYWNTLRNKTGKGYAVVDAMVLEAPEILPSVANLTGERLEIWRAEYALGEWITSSEKRLIAGEAARQSMPRYADRVPTPRTGREGRNVILALLDPQAPAEALFEAALAVPQERFLWNLALTHPNCPEEAKVARALMVNAL